MVESVSDEEIARWRDRPNPVADTRAAQNAVLAVARRLDPAIENFTDLDRLVRTHPEWDAEIARAYRDSGYLDLWKTDFEVNTWHYDLNAIERLIPRPISGMFWPASQTTPSTALANSPPGTGRAMPGLSRQHKQLSKALLELDEEAMLLEELDGFIAGLLVCPQMIPPSAWLPWVWNSEDGQGEPVHGGEKTIQWSACVCAGAGGVKVGHWIG